MGTFLSDGTFIPAGPGAAYGAYDPSSPAPPPPSSWTAALTRVVGLSFLASVFSREGYLFDSVKLFLLGTIIETGRRLCGWLVERFRFQYAMTAQFDEGDPAYEWIVLFLTQEKVWRRSRDFRVSAKNSRRKWGIDPRTPRRVLRLLSQSGALNPNNASTTTNDKAPIALEGNADYVPTYELPQLFRWRGYWLEIKRSKGSGAMGQFGGSAGGGGGGGTIYVSIYTLDMSVLSALVEEARLRYIEVSRPDVIIHLADSPTYGPAFAWTNVKRKVRRPLSSIILQEGMIESLVKDAQEFIDTEEWYVSAGIPHRRGYLLYGPPGTGKSSTIYALAGELGLEIYSLSLASGFVDDSFLQRAASSIPKHSVFLIEDIDCAFPSREDADDDSADLERQLAMGMGMGMGAIVGGTPSYLRSAAAAAARRSAVTLSGLLNVIDGVGSEEGKLFFATTNYVDRLDPALLRPGRIDMKIPYSLATKGQARALFIRFFPAERFPDVGITTSADSAAATATITTTTIATFTTTTDNDSDDDETPHADKPTDGLEKPPSPPPTPAEGGGTDTLASASGDATSPSSASTRLHHLADLFSAHVPPDEFSTAELQGYLLSCKKQPEQAAAGVGAWVAMERGERRAREEREERRMQKMRETRERMMEGGAGGARGGAPDPVKGRGVVMGGGPIAGGKVNGYGAENGDVKPNVNGGLVVGCGGGMVTGGPVVHSTVVERGGKVCGSRAEDVDVKPTANGVPEGTST